MKIKIEDNQVTIDDAQGNTVYLSKDQLLEIVRLINLASSGGDDIVFESLEFSV